jgi:hypothetical protein
VVPAYALISTRGAGITGPDALSVQPFIRSRLARGAGKTGPWASADRDQLELLIEERHAECTKVPGKRARRENMGLVQ